MKINYRLTLADYKAALRRHTRQKLSRRIADVCIYVLSPIFAAMVMAFLLFLDFNFSNARSNYSIQASHLLIVILLLALIRNFTIRRQFKRLFPPAQIDRSLLVGIDGERTISAIPGASEGKFFWKSVYGFAQDDKVTPIYVSKVRFLFYPTTAMSPAQGSELAELFARNLVNR